VMERSDVSVTGFHHVSSASDQQAADAETVWISLAGPLVGIVEVNVAE
jgi:hypothetical protein